MLLNCIYKVYARTCVRVCVCVCVCTRYTFLFLTLNTYIKFFVHYRLQEHIFMCISPEYLSIWVCLLFGFYFQSIGVGITNQVTWLLKRVSIFIHLNVNRLWKQYKFNLLKTRLVVAQCVLSLNFAVIGPNQIFNKITKN